MALYSATYRHRVRWALSLLGSVALGGSAVADEPLVSWQESLWDASNAQSQGDYVKAEAASRAALAARPRGTAGGRASLSLGLALQGQGRFAEAATALENALEQLTDRELSIIAMTHRADALFYSGEPEASVLLFENIVVDGDGLASRRANWRAADALMAAGLTSRAREAYERLLLAEPRNDSAPGALLSLANVHLASGRKSRAAQILQQLWTDNPADPVGAAAGLALSQIRQADRAFPAPTPRDRLARVEKLLAQARPEQALAEIESATFPRPLLRHADLLRAFSLLRLGRRSEAEELGHGLFRSDDPGIRAGATLVLAQVAARARHTEQATDLYRQFASNRARVPGLTRAKQRELRDNAEYLAAWLYYDGGKLETAIERFDRYLQSNPPRRSADEARWFRAWSLHRLGRNEEARSALVELERGSFRAASLYWQSRMSQSQAASDRLYRTVVRESPRSWYGLLSGSRLSAPDESPGQVPPPVRRETEDIKVPDVTLRISERASRQIGLGLREEGLAELRFLARGDGARRDAAWVAQMAAFAEDAEIPFRLARDALPFSPQTARWRCPFAYPDIVPKTATAFGLDQHLLQAIMLRESAFRPGARSSAGAQGLMQMLPRTAERLTVLLGLPPDEPGRLNDPETSVNLAAHYLALLSERFGDPASVLSAYNAGPEAAASWAPTKGGAELDEWVENIRYRETRLYVKTVLAEYVSYRLLYGASAIDLSWKIMPPRDGVAF